MSVTGKITRVIQRFGDIDRRTTSHDSNVEHPGIRIGFKRIVPVVFRLWSPDDVVQVVSLGVKCERVPKPTARHRLQILQAE